MFFTNHDYYNSCVDLETSCATLILYATTQTTYKANKYICIRNNTPFKRKAFIKHAPKERVRRYGHEIARNAENGATVNKIQLTEGLLH